MNVKEQSIKRYLNKSRIPYEDLLEAQNSDHHENLRDCCIGLLETLGYSNAYITETEDVPIQNPNIDEDFFQATVIRDEPGGRPHIVALTYLGSGDEVKIKPDGIDQRSELEQLRKLFDTDCEYFIVFGNEFMVIGENSERYYNYLLGDLDDGDIPEMLQLLEPPENLR